MSLGFLVPLFLLGLAGIAIPVIIHLTRRQRRQVVAFPSLMFLEKIPFQEQRRRRIQNWLLLALRALALGLLALAFARPFRDDPALAAAGGGGPTEVVVLVDRSYSMGVGSQWARAQGAAADAFRRLGPLDRASLVFFSQGAEVALRSTPDRARLRGALDTTRVGWGVTRFGPALKVAQTILEETELPAGEVVVISDFQRTGWRGDEGVRLPAGTTVTPVSVQEPVAENVRVADVALQRQAASGRERVTPTARVVRTGGEGVSEIEVVLELDGQGLQTRTVRLEPGEATSVAFSPFTLSLPHTRGSVRVPADAVPSDDARHFVLSPGGSLAVVAVEGGRAGPDASLYVRRALETTEDGRFAVRVRRGDGVRAEDLEDADVLILNDARLDGASAELVRAFAEGGGGILVVAGEAASWPASAADVLPGTLGAVEDRVEGRGGRLGYLEYDHPVFEVFSGPRSGDFSGARFFRARGFTPGDSARVIARFDDGTVAMAERSLGRGTVAVWTSTLDVFWNDLALQPVFLPFLHRVAEHLSGHAEALSAFTVGQVVDLADPEAMEAAGLVSSEAAGLEEGDDPIALSPSGGTVQVAAATGRRHLSLDEAGFYVVRPPGSEPERPFTLAVNVDLEESSLEALDPQELVAQILAPPSGPSAGPTFEAAELRREDRERRQGLWRYLLLAAFALFLVDTGISNWMSRRTTHMMGVSSAAVGGTGRAG
ncbi:MAG: BatA domain-containing protein [Longimicrobiales bacterium]|nr:BatA domain-containing protein [Longimicrobiales bacterium]